MNNHFLAEVFAITKKKGGKAPVISELSVTENGTYEAPTGVDGYSPVIVNVPTGGGGATSLQSGANLIDYDGSLVQHYTKEEFLALTEMPSNPSHTGLVAQGWNWSLADAKTYIEKYGSLNIGQMYTTDTGDTRIYIHIDEDTPQNRLTFYVRFASSVANNVDIDWGDGTVETKGSTIDTIYPHTYATGGDYLIKLKVNTGTISFNGTGSSPNSGQSIYGDRANINSYNRGRIRRVEIGNGVTHVGDSVFYGCYSLTSIIISKGVTSIGYNAFYNCYSLTLITIPDSVISIGNSAFCNCNSLTSIAIADSVTSIGENVFYGCYSITSIIIPKNVTSIGTAVFASCFSLTSIIIPDSVTNIGASAFSSCYSLISIILPNSVTIMGDTVFQNCRSLMSVIISDNVTSVGSSTFNDCYSLNSIIIPDSVINIKGSAFNGCHSLTVITIPRNVTNIANNAFASCYGISEYHLLPTTPPTLANTNAFNNIASDCKIYVPYSTDHSILAAYQAATNWSNFASKMVEEPQP